MFRRKLHDTASARLAYAYTFGMWLTTATSAIGVIVNGEGIRPVGLLRFCQLLQRHGNPSEIEWTSRTQPAKGTTEVRSAKPVLRSGMPWTGNWRALQRTVVDERLYTPDLSQKELLSKPVCGILQSNVMKLIDFLLKTVSEPLVLKAIPVFAVKASHGVLLSMI